MLGGRPQTKGMAPWGASAPALLCLMLATTSVAAEKVGVAAAVNPDAFSSLAGKPQSQINIGKSIFYNERINTTTSGIVQVLLVAIGSFVNNGTTPAGGVIGNWNVNSANYRATGIFAGSGVSVIPATH